MLVLDRFVNANVACQTTIQCTVLDHQQIEKHNGERKEGSFNLNHAVTQTEQMEKNLKVYNLARVRQMWKVHGVINVRITRRQLSGVRQRLRSVTVLHEKFQSRRGRGELR